MWRSGTWIWERSRVQVCPIRSIYHKRETKPHLKFLIVVCYFLIPGMTVIQWNVLSLSFLRCDIHQITFRVATRLWAEVCQTPILSYLISTAVSRSDAELTGGESRKHRRYRETDEEQQENRHVAETRRTHGEAARQLRPPAQVVLGIN